jgi:hypothetical protein
VNSLAWKRKAEGPGKAEEATEMDATESQAQPQAAPVLGYAIQQQRWERGILWLTCIVFVTQLLTLPAGICNYALLLSWSFRWRFLTPTLGIIELCWAAASLVAAITAFLLLLQVRRTHAAFMISALLVVGMLLVRMIFTIGYYRWSYRWGGVMSEAGPVLTAIAEFTLWSYPLVLLAAVTRRSDGTQRNLRAAAIWWMTAVAALLVAAPAVFHWLSYPQEMWEQCLVQTLAVFIGKDWWQSLTGIGMLAGSLAAFSVIFAIAWTLYRGVSGRWALMICAALWVVFATGTFGTNLGLELYHPRFGSAATVFSLSFFADDLREAALSLSSLAGCMAFPLAIRVALTLSDVRARLEGKS